MLSLHAPTTHPALLAHDWYCPWWHSPEEWGLGQTEALAEPSIPEIASLIVASPWCPAVYRGGVRRESHFIQSRLIVLDYDDGMTLREAEHKFRRYRHIIGTTKSHQIWKGTHPPCDRFRVVLFLMHNVYSLRVYKENYASYVDLAKSDNQVKDAARFFFPCVEIISCNEGYSIPYLVSPIARIKRTATRESNDRVVKEEPRLKIEYHGTKETVNRKKRWFGMERWQQFSFHEGLRNKSCFMAACDLFEQGKGISEVESWIFGVGTSLPEAQVRRTILSARKRKGGF